MLAWALVGSLLLMRSFSVSPEASPGNPTGGGDAGAAAVLVNTRAADEERVLAAGTAAAGTLMPGMAEVSVQGQPAGQEDFQSGTSTSAPPTPAEQDKPARAILGDEGGVYYFPLAGSAAAPTATWYVKVFTPKPTSTPRPTYTPSSTATPRASFTPRYPATATLTPSLMPTLTDTLAPSLTPTAFLFPTRTHTPINTATPTATHTATATATLPAELPPVGTLAFVSRGQDGAADSINLLDLPGESFDTIAEQNGVELCGWSPDGMSLLVQLPRGDSGLTDLQMIAVDGTLTAFSTALPGSSQCGDWRNDGSALLFPYTDEGGVTSLSELMLASGELRQVYQDGNGISRPQLLPDGSKVVFITHDGAGSDVVLLDLSAGSVDKLTDTIEAEDTPKFSPDGQSVVFARQVEGQWALFTVNLATREETRLTLTSGSEWQPDRSTDGQYLLFTSDEGGASNIYAYKAGMTAPYPLLPGTESRDTPLWRP